MLRPRPKKLRGFVEQIDWFERSRRAGSYRSWLKKQHARLQRRREHHCPGAFNPHNRFAGWSL